MTQEERDQLETPKYQLNKVVNMYVTFKQLSIPSYKIMALVFLTKGIFQVVGVIMNAENILFLCDLYVSVNLRNLQLSKAR